MKEMATHGREDVSGGVPYMKMYPSMSHMAIGRAFVQYDRAACCGPYLGVV